MAMTVNATLSVISRIEEKHVRPKMVLYFGFTGYILPWKSISMRFFRIMPGKLPGFSVAPTIATDGGLKKVSIPVCPSVLFVTIGNTDFSDYADKQKSKMPVYGSSPLAGEGERCQPLRLSVQSVKSAVSAIFVSFKNQQLPLITGT